jgi:F-box protein 39
MFFCLHIYSQWSFHVELNLLLAFLFVYFTVKISPWSIMAVAEHYGSTLRTFGHLGHPRFGTPRKFTERNDSLLVLLARACPHLRTLVVRERVSTCTLLLIADAAPNLDNFYVRGNAVVLKNDWPVGPEWSPYFAAWLKTTSRSYEATEREIGQRLGKRDWKLLRDDKFKTIQLDVRLQ